MYSLQTISELKAKKAFFTQQIKHIDALLGIGTDIDDTIDIDSSFDDLKCPYKKSDSNQEKFALILKQQNKFLSINELADFVHQFEPKISLDDAKKSLGSAKNLLLKSGAIVKVQIGTNNSNSFYGSASWLKDDGTPKDEHKYNESALQIKKQVII